jgi:hypothetical protein
MKRAVSLFFFALAAPIAFAQFPFGFWKTVGAGATAEAPVGNSRTLTYASDGDANGVFYFFGQNFNAGGTWTNPNTAGRLPITVTAAMLNGGVDNLVNRAAEDNYTTNVANSNFVFDLGSGRALSLTVWSYRARTATTSQTPTALSLEGSNDGSSWTAIDARSGISVTATGQWKTFTSTSSAFRYFRLKQTALNNGGDNFFTIAEFELYGTLTY